jgi:GNAT superfamily N-acetyltransferase
MLIALDESAGVPPVTALDDAIAEIDRLHTQDPAQRELGYAQRMTHWLERLDANPDPLLRIAVRAQHLQRWLRPRADYPVGRTGYLKWRRDAAAHHAELVAAAMRTHGFADAEIERVIGLVKKRGIGRDPDAQTLEDCACLTFLETELAAFVQKHPQPKGAEILDKTWRKMSSTAQRLAQELLPARDHP